MTEHLCHSSGNLGHVNGRPHGSAETRYGVLARGSQTDMALVLQDPGIHL